MKNILNLIILGLICCLTACTTTPWRIKINAANHLNVDQKNHALPVQLIIYQLRDDQAFKQATFQQLWQNDKEILGNSLLSRRQLSVAPGARINLNILPKKTAAYVAVLAIFRKPTSGHWRASKKMDQTWLPFRKRIVVSLNQNHIVLH